MSRRKKIYVEMETVKLAQLGISPTDITSAIQAQNAMTPSGMFETSTDNVYLRISGMFEKIEDLKSLPIRAGGRTFRLGDIAKIERSFAEPAEAKFYYNGQPAIGVAVSMERGGNILALGENLKDRVSRMQKELPAGLELHTVFNQPLVVKESIDEFTKSLAEAIAIVLIVCFISLGIRSGLVVAFCISARYCRRFYRNENDGDRFAQYFSRCADHSSGIVGGRCDHRHRNDDRKTRTGVEPR